MKWRFPLCTIDILGFHCSHKFEKGKIMVHRYSKTKTNKEILRQIKRENVHIMNRIATYSTKLPGCSIFLTWSGSRFFVVSGNVHDNKATENITTLYRINGKPFCNLPDAWKRKGTCTWNSSLTTLVYCKNAITGPILSMKETARNVLIWYFGYSLTSLSDHLNIRTSCSN